MRRPPLIVLLLAAVLVGACCAGAIAATDQTGIKVEAEGVAPLPVEEPSAGIEQPPAEAPALPPPTAEPAAPPQPTVAPAEAQPTPIQGPLEVPAPIVSVEVVGNRHIPTDEILGAIKSKVGGVFSEEQVSADAQAVRNLGWFERVWVDRESTEVGIRLVFRVAENPVIREIQFDGPRELKPEDLLAVMKTQPEQVYSAPLLAKDALAIEDLYRSKGYILAFVVGQKMSQDGVLTLVIAEGEIEEIRITGNTHSKTYAIRRYIRTKVGETYNDRRVARDVARLTTLDWFETVRRDAEVGTEPGKVVLIITVVEKRRTGIASVGGGYSSVQGLVGFIDLTKSNLGGNGQQVTIRGEFGGRESYELGYQHPWIMTPETKLSAGIYDRLILREAFVTDDQGERRSILYDERRNGGNVTLGRPFSDNTTVFLGLRMDDVQITGVSEEEREKFLQGAAFEPRQVRSLTLAAVNDTRSESYNPRRGSYERFSAEFAGLILGGVEFNKYVNDYRKFFPAGRRNVLAFRLLAGTVTGDPPYLEQFLLGGSESLRGYRSDRFVGTRMAVLNSEYRFPMGSNLLGVVFVDLGDAWGGSVASEDAFGDVVHGSFTAHVGYGAGVRVRTPIGALRLDLGFSEEGTETHFGVRHMF